MPSYRARAFVTDLEPSPERRVAALAAQLVERSSLSLVERRLLSDLSGLPTTIDADAEAVAAAIQRGEDLLGEQLLAARSTNRNREDGATYTPMCVTDAMMAHAAKGDAPARIVDPGAGSGRFTIAAASVFPSAEIVAVELDPISALVLRANLAVLGLTDRVTVYVGDFRDLRLPPIEGTTLFVGNPPYVRHHDITPEWKEWYSGSLARFGVNGSQLAGLHLHFFVKALSLASPRDRGCFITAAEWLDVNYGSALRRLLIERLGLTSLDVVDPAMAVFPGTMTSAVITSFDLSSAKTSPVAVRWHHRAESLGTLGGGAFLCREQLRVAARWTPLARGIAAGSAPAQTVGDLFRVSRGQVTGANKIWVVDPRCSDVPRRFLRPTVTRAAELIAAQPVLRDCSCLKAVVDLPADLAGLPDDEQRAIQRFLMRARAAGAHTSYVARHRNPWYSVKLYDPAPILCTYMGRRPPVFVVNEGQACHINVAHGLYPRRPLTTPQIRRVVDYLNTSVGRESGRTYAGGLTKFEPGEIERLPLPSDILDSGDAETLAEG